MTASRSHSSSPRATAPLARALAFLFSAAVCGWWLQACAPGAPSSPEGTAGTLIVRASTTGINAPASFPVDLDGDPAGSVEANGEIEFPGISPGTHAVGLSPLPVNCGVDGANPRQVAIAEAATTEAAFVVTCGSLPTGDVEVTTSTSGEDRDEDGYDVSIEGTARGAIGPDDTRLFGGVPIGSRQVELSGIADNCAVQGSNPRSVTVSQGQVSPTTFAILCELTTGSIDVSVSTSGLAEDDAYTVDLDGGARSETVSMDGGVTFDEVEPGLHTVTLGDVAGNCDVETDNPVDVTVTAGETVDVQYRVRCGLF